MNLKPLVGIAFLIVMGWLLVANGWLEKIILYGIHG